MTPRMYCGQRFTHDPHIFCINGLDARRVAQCPGFDGHGGAGSIREDDDADPGGYDPRPNPRTHPEYWRE